MVRFPWKFLLVLMGLASSGASAQSTGLSFTLGPPDSPVRITLGQPNGNPVYYPGQPAYYPGQPAYDPSPQQPAYYPQGQYPGRVPPGHYYCQQHHQYCNHGQRHGGDRDSCKRKQRQRHRQYNYGAPAGHYYCAQHHQYCSHR